MEFLAGLALVGGLFGAYTSIDTSQRQAEAVRKKAEYENQLADINSQFLDLKAEDAIYRGKIAQADYGKQARQLIGAQRVAAAAQGISLDTGSALEIEQDTRKTVNNDLLTIKANAYREAMGYKAQAYSTRLQALLGSKAAQNEAENTLLTGKYNAISSILGGVTGAARNMK